MGRIAVIDDAKADLDLIAEILKTARHEVRTFQDVGQIEERLTELVPDLILLDIVLPERSGYEILRNLKRNSATQAIPVVLVSSKKEPHDIAWGKRQGAEGYLPKPFTAEQLLAEVSRWLNR